MVRMIAAFLVVVLWGSTSFAQFFKDYEARDLAITATGYAKKAERRITAYNQRLGVLETKFQQCQQPSNTATPCNHSDLEQGIRALKAELGIVDGPVAKGKKRPKNKIEVLQGLYATLRAAQSSGWKVRDARLNQLEQDLKRFRSEDFPSLQAQLINEIREAIFMLRRDAEINKAKLDEAVVEMRQHIERLKQYDSQLDVLTVVKTDIQVIKEHLADLERKLEGKQDMLRLAFGAYGRYLYDLPKGYGGGIRMDVEIPYNKHPYWRTIASGGTGYQYMGWAISARFMEEVGTVFRFRFGFETEISVRDKGVVMMTPAFLAGFAIPAGRYLKFYAETGPAWRIGEDTKKFSLVAQGGVVFYLQ